VRNTYRLLLLIGLLLAMHLPVAPVQAQTVTFNVTTTADDGPGSLRQAITDANNAAANAIKRIEFTIANGSIIALQNPIDLTANNTTIDGTKGDPSPNPTPKIAIVPETDRATSIAYGIAIKSNNNTIRGLAMNNFRGSRASPLVLDGATNTRVAFNYLGLDLAGTTSIRNGFTLALIRGASNNTIENNVISSGTTTNLFIGPTITTVVFPLASNTTFQSNNRIQNNIIGLSVNGTAFSSGRAQVGMTITNHSNDNIIGPGNIIAGNGTNVDTQREGGLRVEGRLTASDVPTPEAMPSGTRVIGNFIGTNASGANTLGNNQNGVVLSSSVNTVIGGPTASDRNIISSNGTHGILVRENGLSTRNMTNLLIENNYIGITPSGNAALPNGTNGAGIEVQSAASNLTIRGNVIGSNRLGGVRISSLNDTRAVENITVVSNIIGLGADGNTELGNNNGVEIVDLVQNIQVTSNRITKNAIHGINIRSNGSSLPNNVTIANNQIGLNLNGEAKGNGDNGASGIFISHGTNLTIGNDNLISGHTSAGITVGGSNSTLSGVTVQGNQLRNNRTGLAINNSNNNTITGNQVRDNAQAGIRVDGTANGPANGNRLSRNETSGNGLGGIVLGGTPPGNQSGPVRVTAASANLNQVSVTINNCPSGTCTVEVFGDSGAVTNEGPIFLGSGTGNSSAPIAITLNPCARNLIFTATDAAGNTSPFHLPTQNATCVPGTVELSAATPSSSQSTTAGGVVNYTHTVRNGGGTAANVNIALSSSAGWNATILSNPFPVALAPGESREFTIRVQVPGNATAGASDNLTVTPVLNGQPQPSLNRVNTTSVTSGPAVLLQLQPNETDAKSGAPGATVTYNLRLQNTGGTAGEFSLNLTNPAGWNAILPALSPPTLAPNEIRDFTLQVTVPAGTPAGTSAEITVNATVSGGTPGSLRTTTTASLVAVAPQFQATAGTTRNAAPGQQVEFTFQLSNLANGNDSFAISLPNSAAIAGWTTSFVPGSQFNNLAPNTPTNVTLRVTPPTDPTPNSGAYNFSIQACSTTAPQPCANAINLTVQIVEAAVPRLDVQTATNVQPGAVVTLTHTLQNVGTANGSFNLSTTLPAGWTQVTLLPSSPVAVNRGASTAVTLAVRSPVSALAGPYTVVLRAQATDSNAASTSVDDTVEIARVPALQITPVTTTLSVEPDSVFTETLTIRNDGNFTDIIDVSGINNRPGWVTTAVPAAIEVPARSSHQVEVGTLVPPGVVAGTVNLGTITASYRGLPVPTPGRSASATIKSTVIAVPGVRIGPAQQNKFTPPTVPIIFTFTLTNSGSIDQSYTLALSGLPTEPDWTIELPPTAVGPLVPGATQQLTLRIIPPTAAEGRILNIEVRATANDAPRPSAVARAILLVGKPYDLDFVFDNNIPVFPGSIVRFRHILTNRGVFTDTVSLRAQSSLGWETLPVAPSTVSLAPSESITVEVTILVPTSLLSGEEDALVVEAQSAGDRSIKRLVTNRMTVAQIFGVSVGPNRPERLRPGGTYIFDHQLINTGNGTDQYLITAEQDANWPVEVVIPETPQLAPGRTFLLRIQVQVPYDVDPRVTNRVRLNVRSMNRDDVTDQAINLVLPLYSDFRVYTPQISGPPVR
jgi:parallel beta-helix repeat protein